MAGGGAGAAALAGEQAVSGDLLRLRDATVLRHLDNYEGSDYERVLRSVRLWDGSRVDAWVYEYHGVVEGRLRVAGGNWLD